MADDLHPLTVRISELTEEWADRERHAANVIRRAIEGQQQQETRGNKA